MPASTNDISERYLKKAVAEMNELGHEIAEAAGPERAPVLGSGHPLADILLLKHQPQTSEIHEGVAFFGRTGQAVLKSIQRLRVDPMAIYGTNCFKYEGEEEDEADRFLTRELHIVQPKLVVVMGQDALACLTRLNFPLATAARGDAGDDPAADADGGGAARSGHRHRPRRAGGEEGILGRLQGNRTLVVRAAAVLALAAALVIWSEIAPHLGYAGDWGSVAVVTFLVAPAMFAMVWLALPAREGLGPVKLGWVAAALVLAAILFEATDLLYASNFTKFAAATVLGWWFLTFFEAPWWVLLVAVIIIPVDLYSVAQGPTKEITENRPEVFDSLSVFMRIPGTNDAGAPLAPQLGLPDVLFFALFLGACAQFALRVGPTWFAMVLSFGATISAAVLFEQNGVAALPLLSLAFVLVNADLLWRSIRPRAAGRPRPASRPGARRGITRHILGALP